MGGDLGGDLGGMGDPGLDDAGIPGGDPLGDNLAQGNNANPSMGGSPLPPAGAPQASRNKKIEKSVGSRKAGKPIYPGKVLHAAATEHLLESFEKRKPKTVQGLNRAVRTAERLARKGEKNPPKKSHT